MTEYLERQLGSARQSLLDLTMRNRLLNFRPTKRSTVRVVDEIPAELYEILVLNERVMQFLPKPETKEGQESENDLELEGLTLEEAKLLWEVDSPSEEIAKRHTDRFLQTSLESQVLQKQLFFISQRAQSVLEEQGYTVLYLAFGFLQWTESPDSEQERKAPLLLIPVELDRAKVRQSFKLKWTTEDVFTNISLQAKLVEQGIKFPDFEMPEEKDAVHSYFQAVEKCISGMNGWSVQQDVYLGFFSFTKFIMYKDLDPNSWPKENSPTEHPLLKAILDPSEKQAIDDGFSENEVDEKLRSEDVIHVSDADPSQIAVIEDVKSGRNLVVEGPPGTGKSQTITNIIAELLSKGKSVLFVSEKMAALEVVKSRLDQVGLRDFCLELHSRKVKKKEVLKELERSLSDVESAPVKSKGDYKLLDKLRTELNDYVKALREPLGKTNFSPFFLYGMSEEARCHFRDSGRDPPRLRFPAVDECDQTQLADVQTSLQNLADVLPVVEPLSQHPWRGCSPELILPSDQGEIGASIDECTEVTHSVETVLDQVSENTGVWRPERPSEIPNAISAAGLVALSKPVNRTVLLNEGWDKSSEVEVLVRTIERLQQQLPTVRARFVRSALDRDITSLLNEYKVLSTRLLRFFNSRYRSLKREIAGLYKKEPPRRPKSIVSDLENLLSFLGLRHSIKESEDRGLSLFGHMWKGEKSDLKTLHSFAEWISPFREYLKSGILTDRAVGIVEKGVVQQQIEQEIEKLSHLTKHFVEKRDLLFKLVSADPPAIFGAEIDQIEFRAIGSRFKLWRSALPQLQEWSQFIRLRGQCVGTLGEPVIEQLDNDRLKADDVVPCFRLNFSDSLLHVAFKERPALANFLGSVHQLKIQRFAKLDRKLISVNRWRLTHQLYKNRPTIYSGASRGSEAGLLLGEFNRKRGHMPIRKLMLRAGGLIKKLRPCFMMSPLSIAQFLEPANSPQFDVIIFDEASQVRPEDALGALLRGQQVCVIGDTKQLPPTSFFDHLVEMDEDEEEEEFWEASITETESILHQCKRTFPTKLLRWHYRSKHESLIAVSNQEFYDNALLIYPSPWQSSKDLGLQFFYLADAVYDRGRSSVNRLEARAVAEAAIDHYRKYPEKSLGVGTFNIKQQQAIFEEIELQLRLHPEMENFFSSDQEEHFFVKNLETIQGDERDVIFLSVGFGRDAQGRLTLNFGPLNHEGGWRRLNVLITRARERCVVFSNFRASDLRVDGTASLGLKALKTFLDFAETRNLTSIGPQNDDTDSPFEDSVYEFLRGHGIDVQTQVGCAGFRVDLGIMDPNSPGQYLLGIECDGAKYHSSPVARDRDRLRQQILEDRGWRISRIWSTDWYRNRSEAEKKLLRTVEEAKQTGPIAFRTKWIESRVTAETSKASTSSRHLPLLPKEKTLEQEVPLYELCSSLSIRRTGELHEQPIHKLITAIENVVRVEGPVHCDEVVRRIRTLWGLKRAGNRIRETVRKAALAAKRKRLILWKGDFLWSSSKREIQVRRRETDPSPNIDLICNEEIAEAVKLVLRGQYATALDDLAIKTGRVLGMQAVHAASTKRIKKVIRRLVVKEVLHKTSSGMIDFTG